MMNQIRIQLTQNEHSQMYLEESNEIHDHLEYNKRQPLAQSLIHLRDHELMDKGMKLVLDFDLE